MRRETWAALLLGMGPVAACGTVSPPVSSATTQTSTSDSSSTGSSGSTSTTSPATVGSTNDEGTTASSEESTTSSGTTSDTTASSSSSDGPGTSMGETEEGNEACTNGCAVEFACGSEWKSEEECVSWCEANLEKAYAFSIFCRAAWEGVSACVGTLSCEEFMLWENPVEFPYPCSDADTILSVECKGQ